MMHSNVKTDKRVSVLTSLEATERAAGDVNTSAVDFSKIEHAQAVVVTSASADVSVKFEQSQDDTFTAAKDIEGRDAQTAVAGGVTLYNIEAGELDIDNGYRYARAVLTHAGANSTSTVVVLGYDARYQPLAHAAGTVVNARA